MPTWQETVFKPSLKSDASCGMYAAYHMGGYNKHKYACGKGDNVDYDDAPHGNVHRDTGKIITFWVESDNTGGLLYEKQCKGYDVSEEQPAQDNHGRKIQENGAQLSVCRSHSLHYTYETSALQYNDEQAANHSHTGNTYHQHKNGHNVRVQQCEP